MGILKELWKRILLYCITSEQINFYQRYDHWDYFSELFKNMYMYCMSQIKHNINHHFMTACGLCGYCQSNLIKSHKHSPNEAHWLSFSSVNLNKNRCIGLCCWCTHRSLVRDLKIYASAESKHLSSSWLLSLFPINTPPQTQKLATNSTCLDIFSFNSLI